MMADREKVIGLLQETAEYFRECRNNASFASKAENHFWELQNAANEAVELLKELEPHVIGLSEIEDGGGYWLTTMSSDFIPRPVIVVHNEKDAGKPYITLAWQYGTFSWEAKTYGIAWRLWSAKPIGREWRGRSVKWE